MSDVREQLSAAGRELSPRSGLRVRPQRPVRAIFGALLVVGSVVAALAVFTRVGDRREVLAVNRPVLAGEQLVDADLKVVSISSDEGFPSLPATDRELVVGQYARVRLAADGLLVSDSIQPEPLVDSERVLMSVPVPLSGVPVGLREGSRVALIVTADSTGGSPPAPVLVEANVAAVPTNLGELVGGNGESGTAAVALSVEVPPGDAALVGSAAEVAVAVLDPSAPFPAQPAELAEPEPSTPSEEPPAVSGLPEVVDVETEPSTPPTSTAAGDRRVRDRNGDGDGTGGDGG